MTRKCGEKLDSVRDYREKIPRLSKENNISNGVNNKIKLDKRMAFGYLNFSN
ncbi:MAG: transposase, partial [bacterium]